MAGKTLKIAVLGAGNIGSTLGKKWLSAGHQIYFGVNNPAGKNADALRAELAEQVAIGTIEEVLRKEHDVVLVALPGGVVETIAQRYAALLNGRIIIDAANRFGEDSLHNLTPFQQHAPEAQVYRAFNTLGWENFADPTIDGVQVDHFYCGPQGETLATVEQLIAEVGLRPIYLGGNEQVKLLDGLTALWFNLAIGQKKGRHLAFKVLGM